LGSGNVNIYKCELESFVLNPSFRHIATLKGKKNTHGATFSPTGEYLSAAYTIDQGEICTYRIGRDRNKNIAITKIQSLQNPFYPLKPKSIAFSFDSKFVVIGYCVKVTTRPGEIKAILASHKFDSKRGKINPIPISYIDNLFSIETLLFTSDCSTILATDQVNDQITAHEFDPNTGKFGESYSVLENPDAQLNRPHGIALSSDDRFLAVSNRGDDKVTIYEVTKK